MNPTVTAISSSTAQASTTSSAEPTTTDPPPETSTAAPTTTSAAPPLTCSSGYRSCPASQGGGCCPTDRECGAQFCPATTTSSAAAGGGAPVRPTSISSAVVTASAEPTTIAATACPTGFYQCSAYYNGGSCCQVGRDCGLTSCPPHATQSVVVSNGVTIFNAPTISPEPNSGAGDQANCAVGWYTCGGDVGGGCCPSGFNCGTASCASASASATASTIPKQNATSAARLPGCILLSLLAIVAAIVA